MLHKTFVGVGPYYVRSGLIDHSRVTNLPTPIHEDDAVSVRALKEYTDTYKISIPINITGTDYVDLRDDILGGTLRIAVEPSNTDGSVGGPIGSWRLSKTSKASIFTETLCKGSDESTFFEVDWPDGATPRLRKTTSNYDGMYLVAIHT